jgi:hypothetical protein
MNMRFILLLAILVTTGVIRLPAQSADSGVEMRLSLIQGVGGRSIKSLALGVSIINHTNSDIYIPGLKSMPYAAGINLYQEENGKFVKIDILGVRADIHPAIFPDSGNAITDIYWKKIPVELQRQDSIILAFCRDNHLPAEKWKRPGNQPLFLKAGQHLDNFQVFNMDHTWKNTGQYKIVFAPGSVDPAYSPAEISGYRRFPSSLVTSNSIYYNNIVL